MDGDALGRGAGEEEPPGLLAGRREEAVGRILGRTVAEKFGPSVLSAGVSDGALDGYKDDDGNMLRVGPGVGMLEGPPVGPWLGATDPTDGCSDGWMVGKKLSDGCCDSIIVGVAEGTLVGAPDGRIEGCTVGDLDGKRLFNVASEGATEGMDDVTVDGKEEGPRDGKYENILDAGEGANDGRETEGANELAWVGWLLGLVSEDVGSNDGSSRIIVEGTIDGISDGADDAETLGLSEPISLGTSEGDPVSSTGEDDGLVEDGCVADNVGDAEATFGRPLGAPEGDTDDGTLGAPEGVSDITIDGDKEGKLLGRATGEALGRTLTWVGGGVVGLVVGARVGGIIGGPLLGAKDAEGVSVGLKEASGMGAPLGFLDTPVGVPVGETEVVGVDEGHTEPEGVAVGVDEGPSEG